MMIRKPTAWDVLCAIDSPDDHEIALALRLLGMSEEAKARPGSAPKLNRALAELRAMVEDAPAVDLPDGLTWPDDGGGITLPLSEDATYTDLAGESVTLKSITLRDPSVNDLALAARRTDTPNAKLACILSGLHEGIWEFIGLADGWRVAALLIAATHPSRPSST